MKEGFQNEKVHFGVRQQTNLLRDQVAHVTRCGRTFPFKKLCPRNRACHQGPGSRDFARNADGGGIDSLGLPSVTGSIQLFPRSEESECLQDLCAGIEKLPMQLAQGIRMLDGHFGCELSTSFSGADFFASRATVHPSATLEFEEVSTVSQYNALLCNLLQYVFSLSHMRSWPCCVVARRRRPRPPPVRHQSPTSRRRSAGHGCHRRRCVRGSSVGMLPNTSRPPTPNHPRRRPSPGRAHSLEMPR